MKWSWESFGFRDNGEDARNESSLLACLLLNPDLCDNISGMIEPDDFVDSRNGILFHHLIAMHKSTGTFDIESLISSLRDSGQYDDIGGVVWLASVVRRSVVPTSEHVKYYASMIHDVDSGTNTESAK